MTSTSLSWYSLDAKLDTCEHAPVDVDRAVEIANDYYTRATKTFDSAEDAIAATLFGFNRSPSEFIEICVNGPLEISYKFESSDPNASWLRRLFGGTFQYETVLRSRAEMIQRVQEFFALSPTAIKAKLQGVK